MDLSENTEIESNSSSQNKDFPYLPLLVQEAELLLKMAIKSLPQQN